MTHRPRPRRYRSVRPRAIWCWRAVSNIAWRAAESAALTYASQSRADLRGQIAEDWTRQRLGERERLEEFVLGQPRFAGDNRVLNVRRAATTKRGRADVQKSFENLERAGHGVKDKPRAVETYVTTLETTNLVRYKARVPLIALEQVSLNLNHRSILEQIDLALERGDVLRVIGANGAGKSTLLKVLRGDLWPTGGLRQYFFTDPPRESPIGARERVTLVTPELQDRLRRLEYDRTTLELVQTGFAQTDYLYAPLVEPQLERSRNVMRDLQLERLMAYPMVRRAVEAGTLTLHGWHYVIEEGEIYIFDAQQGDFVPASLASHCGTGPYPPCGA